MKLLTNIFMRIGGALVTRTAGSSNSGREHQVYRRVDPTTIIKLKKEINMDGARRSYRGGWGRDPNIEQGIHKMKMVYLTSLLYKRGKNRSCRVRPDARRSPINHYLSGVQL
jgi:hypothetical protein